MNSGYLLYQVSIRKSKRGNKSVYLQRSDKLFGIGTTEKLFSKRSKMLFDQDDWDTIHQTDATKKLLAIGSLQITLNKKEDTIEISLCSELFATWSLTDGIVFLENAPPVFRKDKKAIAAACLELIRADAGGIFSSSTEPPIFNTKNQEIIL